MNNWGSSEGPSFPTLCLLFLPSSCEQLFSEVPPNRLQLHYLMVLAHLLISLFPEMIKSMRKETLFILFVPSTHHGLWLQIGVSYTLVGASQVARCDKESACQFRRCSRHRFDRWVRKVRWSGKWQPIPAFLPGKSQGQRRLAGYSPWGNKESDTTEWLSTHTLVEWDWSECKLEKDKFRKTVRESKSN